MSSKISGSLTRVQQTHSRNKGLDATTTNAHAHTRVVATGAIAVLAATGSVVAQISAEGGGATISLSLEHIWSLLWFGVALYAINLAHRGLKSNYRIEDAIADGCELGAAEGAGGGEVEKMVALSERVAVEGAFARQLRRKYAK